ncbi:MAG TPA: acyl carrier protein, partial [Polyangiaceae bacterium]|nr:acyl carrier protein [Polyangiaceae bacterium]
MLKRSVPQVVEFECDLESTAPELVRAFDSVPLQMLRVAIACELAHAAASEAFGAFWDLVGVEIHAPHGSSCEKLVAEVDTQARRVVVRTGSELRAQVVLSARAEPPRIDAPARVLALPEALDSPDRFYADRDPTQREGVRCFDAIALDDHGASARIVASDSTGAGFALAPDLFQDTLHLAVWSVMRVDRETHREALRPTRIARVHASGSRPFLAVRIDLHPGAPTATASAFVLGPGGVEEIALEGIELEEGPLAVRDRNELLRLAKETLGFEPDNIESDLVAAGAQSLDLIRLLNAAERELGFVPNRETFFARPTLATLASTRSTTALVEPLESGSLTTAEMQLWILEKEEDVDGAYNQQFAVQILGNVSAVALRQALE